MSGGAGFGGSHLVDVVLNLGYEIIVLDNFSTGRRSNLSHHTKKTVKVVKVDISNNKRLDKYFKGVDYVFHLAGIADIVPSIENPNKYFKSNVVGTLNVVQAAKNSKSGISFPNYKKIAASHKIKYTKILSNKNLKKKLSKVIAGNKPIICELIMDHDQEQMPKAINKRIPGGKTVATKYEDMYPFLSEKELNSNNYEN